MLKKAINFIKYNNLTVFVVLGVFLLSSSVFAQTETGQTVIGSQQTSIEGVDNTLLLEAELDNLPMDFKIEKIEKDEKYYYITYTFINLEKKDSAWQYQIREKVRKISLKSNKDLGLYLANQLREEYDARIKDLKAEQTRAGQAGASARVEVVEYSGLIGKTLEIVGNVFPGYEPVKKTILPAPERPEILNQPREAILNPEEADYTDNLADVYDDYVAENDPDRDNIFGVIDNCPDLYNPDQADGDGDGLGDACDSTLDNSETETGATTPDPNESSEPEENISEDAKEDVESEVEPEENVSEDAEVGTEPEVEIIELPVESLETATTPESADNNAVSSIE